MNPLDLIGLREPRVIEVAGVLYTVEVHPLKTWVAAMHEPLPVLAVLPFLEAQELNRRSYDNEDEVDVSDFAEGWQQALTAATGMQWWVAERLLHALVTDWAELAGALALKGIDALTSPPDLVLSALLAMAVEGMSTKDRRKFEMDLYKPPLPPPGAARAAKTEPPGFSSAEQGAAFLAARGARTTGIRT